MEINFPHEIEYTNHEPISLADIADSLLAQDALIKYLPEILEHSISGLKIDHIKISLKAAESGSLREEFLVALFLAFQGDLKAEVVSGIEALTGVEILQEYDTTVTLLVVLVVLYGARFVYGKLRGGAAPLPASIQGDYNRVLNISAKNLHITPELLESAIGESVGKRPQTELAKATGRFMRPAKRGGASAIHAFGGEMISEESVREFPAEADLLTDDSKPMVPYPDVMIEILALDRQKRGVGWAGRFVNQEVRSPRLTMDLYPTIDLDALRKAEVVRADVIVEHKPAEGGIGKPTRIHLVRVVEVVS